MSTYGWGTIGQKKPNKYLPYHHPKMRRVRAYIQHLIKKCGVHPKLVLNVDQVWCMRYKPQLRKFWKDPQKAGRVQDKLSLYSSRKKLRQRLAFRGAQGAKRKLSEVALQSQVASKVTKRCDELTKKYGVSIRAQKFMAPKAFARAQHVRKYRLPRSAVAACCTHIMSIALRHIEQYQEAACAKHHCTDVSKHCGQRNACRP